MSTLRRKMSHCHEANVPMWLGHVADKTGPSLSVGKGLF